MKSLSFSVVFLMLAGCTATFSPDSEAACYSVFRAFEEAGVSCAGETSAPDPDAICWRAYDHDEQKLQSDCLPWLRAGKCDEYNTPNFMAHCGDTIFLRTW